MEPHVETPGVTSKPQPRRPRRAEDWEDLKPVITEMYARKELKSVMKEMEEHHSFKATQKQYKDKISKWGLNTKRLKEDDFKGMINMERKRARETPGKRTEFLFGGAVVDRAKIMRFKKRRKIADDDDVSFTSLPQRVKPYTPSASNRNSSIFEDHPTMATTSADPTAARNSIISHIGSIRVSLITPMFLLNHIPRSNRTMRSSTSNKSYSEFFNYDAYLAKPCITTAFHGYTI
ncbi:hypothetical protein MMC20_001706 [Loxospora ochrophaea]|nr:hypothetical protein [Loxospora ochrophaea]